VGATVVRQDLHRRIQPSCSDRGLGGPLVRQKENQFLAIAEAQPIDEGKLDGVCSWSPDTMMNREAVLK
jgi:hypothetical protein